MAQVAEPAAPQLSVDLTDWAKALRWLPMEMLAPTKPAMRGLSAFRSVVMASAEDSTWPVEHAKSGASASPASSPLLGLGLGDFQIQLLAALRAQTSAINRLAQSNELLVQAMCDSEGGDLPEPTGFMDQPRG